MSSDKSIEISSNNEAHSALRRLVEGLAESGDELLAYLQKTSEKVKEVLGQGYRMLPPNVQNFPTQAYTIGEIFAGQAREKVNDILKGILPTEAFSHGFPAGVVSSDKRIEASHGKKMVVWLVHPTNYRTDGTPRKFKKQILPANAIGQLWALLPKKMTNGSPGNITVERHFLEDQSQPFDIDEIERSMEGDDVKGVVMLCGVQTNQWPRALDLAALCRARGIPVVAGGYHVQADLPVTQKEAAALGITLALGEAEAVLPDGRPFLDAILEDVRSDNLQAEYRAPKKPDISHTKISEVIPEYQKLTISPWMATMETSRGCPMPCDFCTVRVIGGSIIRARDPGQMKDWLREAYEKEGIRTIFITDDNFARSKERFRILKIFEELRAEGIQIGAMIQVDAMATAGKTGAHFVEACGKAGIYCVFLGLESLDPEVLKDMNKPQNNPEHYKEMISAWHRANIMTQCGFIIGNKKDSKGVGKLSAQKLLDMGLDIASPSIFTPLPASPNYHHFHRNGNVREKDFNLYDSHTAACLEFPGGLSREEVKEEYDSFYREFYSLKNLLRLPERLHGNTLKIATRQWIWYKYASSRGENPMCSGMGDLKPDFVREQFPEIVPPSVADLAPHPHGPGSPLNQKKILIAPESLLPVQ